MMRLQFIEQVYEIMHTSVAAVVHPISYTLGDRELG